MQAMRGTPPRPSAIYRSVVRPPPPGATSDSFGLYLLRRRLVLQLAKTLSPRSRRTLAAKATGVIRSADINTGRIVFGDLSRRKACRFLIYMGTTPGQPITFDFNVGGQLHTITFRTFEAFMATDRKACVDWITYFVRSRYVARCIIAHYRRRKQ